MDSPYLLIPVVFISVFLYSISFILVKTGIIPKIIHRKTWNSLLLITFFITAILGLLLAIQINYKLEWPYIKTMLQWHVNFGIGMSFAAIVHLVWHFNYFLKLFGRENKTDQTGLVQDSCFTINLKRLWLLIILSGFISTVIQVLFLREITTIFQGNELTMAWALGIWMLLTGTGAFIGRNIRTSSLNPRIIQRIMTILAIVPFASILLIVLMKSVFFPPGILINPFWFLLIVSLIFSPVCLLSGWLFSFFVIVSDIKEKGFIRIYYLETIGSMAGGLAVTFIFIWWLSTLESLLITSILIFALLFNTEKGKSYLLSGLVSALVLIVFFTFPVENILKGSIFSNQKVKKSIETWHGNITITENAGQFNIFENGYLAFTSDNTILSEEYVHYAMLQHKNPQNILLVAGGMSGMLKEISKYESVKIIDYIEPNPQFIPVVSKYIPLYPDKRIHLFEGDPRRLIRNSDRKYDVVIMAIPDPASLQVDRLYTTEFIKVLKEKISPGGVVIYGLSPAGNYLTTEKKDLAASMFNNLKTHFRYAEIIPGEKDYFIASDSIISIRISELSGGWEDMNTYVNPYYMDDNSIGQRNKFILTAIKGNQTVNTDEKPRVVFISNLHFISIFSGASLFIIAFPLLLLVLPVFFMLPAARGMFIAGLTASSIEITMIFIFQLIFGYVYSSIGLIIAVFMAGLAIGAILAEKIFEIRNIHTIIVLLLAVSVAVIPACFYLMNVSGKFTGMLLMLLTILIPAILVGTLYYFYSSRLKIERTNAPSIIYAADLLGSAFGVVAVTVFLLPVWGIFITCYILAGINILPVLFNLKKER